MPESLRNNAGILTYRGLSNQVDVAGGTETIRASKPSRDRFSVAACGQGANAGAAVPQWVARTRRRALIWLLASAMAAFGTDDVFSATRLPHAPAHRSKAAEARHHKHTSTQYAKRHARVRHSERHRAAHAIVPSALPIERPASLPPDLAAVKQAIELVRQRKPREATALATSVSDPLMQKLVEWALLRQPESEVGFERYAAFIRTNPDWPNIPLLRRRAEVRLSQERRDTEDARSLLGGEPTSSVDRASGKLGMRAAQDTDKRWRQRRVLARKLIDLGDAKTAYRVVREAATPVNSYYRAEFHFMAGWIALRFLRDPSRALEHFGHVDEGSSDPIVRARAAYWRGRAAEAAGEFEEMRAQYEAAARFPTTYYGQLARARLGLEQIAANRSPPEPGPGIARELQRAADILYSIGERDLAVSFMTDVAEESSDVTAIAALGQLTAHYNDARAMLLIGKTALARGFAMEQYAFPDIGVPPYSAIGPQLDRCIVYSIARTESAFDQRDMSSAKAVGLMQVTPEAGRDTAKRFGVAYDWNRLVSDPVYNTQMGAAEVAALLQEYSGSYIMTFAGYNAGRGRVQQWVAQHGDPRDPKVDAVDWVERIPFAETRNYVQRVMENLQVYCARFGASTATVEPNLHRALSVGSRAKPALVEAIP